MTKHEATAKRILSEWNANDYELLEKLIAAELAEKDELIERMQGMLTEEYKACRITAEKELSQDLANELAERDAEITRLKAENLRLSHEGLLVEKQAAEAERDYFKSKLAEAERNAEIAKLGNEKAPA